jgi:hypothetical protein
MPQGASPVDIVIVSSAAQPPHCGAVHEQAQVLGGTLIPLLPRNAAFTVEGNAAGQPGSPAGAPS